MSSPRQLMDEALKLYVVPALRERGFKGSLPHFRRLRTDRVDLLTIQFDKNGGGFVVEISQCSVEGVTTHWGKHVPASKVTAWDLHPDQRLRLKLRDGSGTDSWFRFDRDEYSVVASQVSCAGRGKSSQWEVRSHGSSPASVTFPW
ncbi:MAG TPA: DUF4304 domain-containing protein [Steroidobacteraceae bacterium]|nr:DUF4304 domain-containing protein [Steroidobacteraceae bacterium]